MNTPNYIKLLHARGAKQDPVSKRRVWGIELSAVWLPYFYATNAQGVTHIPSEALGAPLRLRLDKSGSVKFSANGRPSVAVAPDLRAEVRLVQENFVASLLGYAGAVQGNNEEGYTDQVQAAQRAGQPILQAMIVAVEQAIAAREEAAKSETPQPQPETVGAAA